MKDYIKRMLVAAGFFVVLLPPILFGLYKAPGLRAASIITTGLLSLALVTLYIQQSNILDRQTRLMEQEYESSLAQRGRVTAEKDTIYVSLRNVGRGTIRYLYLRSEIVSDTGSIDLEPGRYQMRRVEDDTRSLNGFCELSEFKGEIKMLIKDKEREQFFRRPFRYIAGKMMQEGIERCTLRLTLEIVDETQESGEEPKEFQIAEQTVRVSREEEQARETEDGEMEMYEVTWPNSVSKGLGPKFPPDADIVPRGSSFFGTD